LVATESATSDVLEEGHQEQRGMAAGFGMRLLKEKGAEPDEAKRTEGYEYLLGYDVLMIDEWVVEDALERLNFVAKP